MRKTDATIIEEAAKSGPKGKLGIEDVSNFRCCLTCVHRKPYPASMRTGRPVFQHFYCSLSMDSQRPVVTPVDVCPHWTGASLEENLP